MDTAFPNNNEEEFLKVKKDILFIYPFRQGFSPKYRHAFLSNKKVKPFTIYKATGDDRTAFENGVNMIYYLEFSKRNDFIFHRNSGMNQVLAKIAKDKGITIAFSFSDWKKALNKASVLGRMQQNFRLCRKYKVKTLVASFAKTPEELADETVLKSFARLLEKRKYFDNKVACADDCEECSEE